ncbi:MAG: nucleotidyl transferase AbiEii/AbiGii toxin family protein [Bacteroidia bacterium]|nr:nucleotidyl transferase AbiEii/AbiGii toxin family protein [Bacteroidia bacterium]
MQKALAPKTEKIFEKISKMETIKPFVLVGGTALSLQINHRKSEDLDFMKWRTSKNEKMEVNWFQIEKELLQLGIITSRNLLDIYLVDFVVDNVKLSFYATEKYSPLNQVIDFHNNIKLADTEAIMAMKLEVLMRRNFFRDYYDIYALLKNGTDIHKAIASATKYSEHQLKTKNLVSILTNGSRFKVDNDFKNLEPIYDVSSKDIEIYIKECLKN